MVLQGQLHLPRLHLLPLRRQLGHLERVRRRQRHARPRGRVLRARQRDAAAFAATGLSRPNCAAQRQAQDLLGARRNLQGRRRHAHRSCTALHMQEPLRRARCVHRCRAPRRLRCRRRVCGRCHAVRNGLRGLEPARASSHASAAARRRPASVRLRAAPPAAQKGFHGRCMVVACAAACCRVL
eukprot:347075-Chlamydomonas_euryale.AAC.9